MNPDALILPQGLEDFAEARTILRGRWGQVHEKTAFSDLRNIGFILTQPCVSFLISGQERLLVEGEPDVVLNAGDLVLIPAGLPFHTDFRHEDGPLRAYLFFFNHALVREFEKNTDTSRSQSSHTVLCLRKNERMSAFMQSMDDVYGGASAENAVVKLKLLELLYFVAGQAGLEKTRQVLRRSPGEARAFGIRDVMQSHFAPMLTVEDYAKIAGRPIASFNRDFKRVFGIPPGKWLFREKMRRAARLLSSSDTTVTQVALELDYQSISHFIDRFRTHFGETPKQYQRRVTSDNPLASNSGCTSG